MPVTYRVLGQAAPAATTPVDVYTVPAGAEVIISSIVVSERGGADDVFRISVRPNDAVQADEHYLAFDTPIKANDVVALSLGVTADAGDVVTVFSGSGDVSFNVFGSEVS
jgi:hypothetical protein